MDETVRAAMTSRGAIDPSVSSTEKREAVVWGFIAEPGTVRVSLVTGACGSDKVARIGCTVGRST
jgi:hypothetical protein